tara:strand:- start:2746 stop:3228 length:483 start_codon:yes stop_codon:yes gene_type:complete
MLKSGERAPEFELRDHTGRDLSLSDLLADGPVILYFYPADFTPGCTREACTIRDLSDELLSVGLTIVGISPQDTESHSRFRQKYGLPFSLLSDTEKTVIRMYGVDGPLGFGVRRATFLIDQDRTIRASVLADLRIGKHADFIRYAIALREAAGMKLQPVD